jgi:hypothetical protein
MDIKKAISVVKNVLNFEDNLEFGSLSQLGWLLKELENAANTKEAQNTSANNSVMSCKNCARLYSNGRTCLLSANHCIRRAEDFYTNTTL